MEGDIYTMILPRTFAVIDKLLKDIEKILYRTTIIVQLIFFGYYGYSIYSNLSNITYLIAYFLLLAFSTIGFIYYLVNYRIKGSNTVRTIKMSFRISKYVINGSMLLLNVFEIIRHGGSDIAYALVILSSISLVIQVMLEFIRGFATLYFDLFTIAVDKDTKFITKFKDVVDFKTHAYRLADSPLEVLTNNRSSKKTEPSKHERLVESLLTGYKEKKSNITKMRRKRNANLQKHEIKEHLTEIKSKFLRKKNHSQKK